ncbi:MAG TPA: hypothetical protein V6C81_19050 [Planktothrix sp.]
MPRRVRTFAISVAISLLTVLPVVAADYNQAVRDYASGNYEKALGEFSELKERYPNNAMVHYYKALCEQSSGHYDQAKTEFAWVVRFGDHRLQQLAQSGLTQLDGAHSDVAFSSSPARANRAKVRKIVELYADW